MKPVMHGCLTVAAAANTQPCIGGVCGASVSNFDTPPTENHSGSQISISRISIKGQSLSDMEARMEAWYL